ncbi:hypothetical protein C8R46DRAFT_1351432 [Mycena filopes]|nr:hypothetical protein C8R46DRAFT_1351432 [Mycena filopes]
MKFLCMDLSSLSIILLGCALSSINKFGIHPVLKLVAWYSLFLAFFFYPLVKVYVLGNGVDQATLLVWRELCDIVIDFFAIGFSCLLLGSFALKFTKWVRSKKAVLRVAPAPTAIAPPMPTAIAPPMHTAIARPTPIVKEEVDRAQLVKLYQPLCELLAVCIDLANRDQEVKDLRATNTALCAEIKTLPLNPWLRGPSSALHSGRLDGHTNADIFERNTDRWIYVQADFKHPRAYTIRSIARAARYPERAALHDIMSPVDQLELLNTATLPVRPVSVLPEIASKLVFSSQLAVSRDVHVERDIRSSSTVTLHLRFSFVRRLLSPYSIAMVYLPLAITMATPCTKWKCWMFYYSIAQLPSASTVRDFINLCLRAGWIFSKAYIEGLMIIGPIALHIATMCLSILFACVSSLPPTCRTLVWQFSCLERSAWFIVDLLRHVFLSYVSIAFLDLISMGLVNLAQYRFFSPDYKTWSALFCHATRTKARAVFWYQYDSWEAEQSGLYSGLRSILSRCFMIAFRWVWDVWCALSWPHKFLVIAPVVIPYALDMIQLLCKYWQWRSQRRIRWRSTS